MDPQSQSFNPSIHSSEPWRLHNDIARVQQIQTEHAERILRLERRQDDDARMKSVWGSTSPFPSVLSGTPQQVPLQQPPNDQFRNFDDEANQLMGSLHLDADEEPRRALGATSRANSVRFDETANQNHFSHSSRPSVDVFSRTSSGLGGIQMTERTSSHKSEGRASSVHSIRSAASGRASSLNLDTAYGLGDAHRSPLDMPTVAPGLMLLGPAPAMIRCWMNTNFKHDALLYAAVCSGSYHSFVSFRLIKKLGFEAIIRSPESSARTIELPMFFPEAVPHPASSRSNSPTPQLPSMLVMFRVIEDAGVVDDAKGIQIFLGSDTLRAHNADILFSSNSLTVFDDDDHKLSIPLIRPENQAVFKTLFTTSESLQHTMPHIAESQTSHENYEDSTASSAPSPPPGLQRTRIAPPTDPPGQTPSHPTTAGPDPDFRPGSSQSTSSRPSLSLINTRSDAANHPSASATSADTASQTAFSTVSSTSAATSPAIWTSWRRDAAATPLSSPQPPPTSGLDWANVGKTRETYQRKETGIKVLKPKASARAFSANVTPTAAAAGPAASSASSSAAVSADGRSRFFDEGRRRSGPEPGLSRAGVEVKKENSMPVGGVASGPGNVGPKTKANPIGGASAFSWLNSGGK